MLRRGKLVDAAEEMEPPELGSERGEIGVGLLVGEQGEGPLHPVDPLLEPVLDEVDLAETSRHPGARVRLADRLERRDRVTRSALLGVFGPTTERCHLSGSLFAAPPCCRHRR